MPGSSQNNDGKNTSSGRPVLGQHPNGAHHAHAKIQGIDDLTTAFKSSVSIANPMRPSNLSQPPHGLHASSSNNGAHQYRAASTNSGSHGLYAFGFLGQQPFADAYSGYHHHGVQPSTHPYPPLQFGPALNGYYAQAIPRSDQSSRRNPYSTALPGSKADNYTGTKNSGKNGARPAPLVTKSRSAPDGEQVFVDWEKEKEIMEEIFERQAADKLKNLPSLLNNPTQFLETTKLEPYQKEAVRWMLDMERNPKENPNCGRKMLADGSQVYFDLHCSSQSNPFYLHRPYSPAKGCILADEMGLGKTLQAISLILYNPPSGHIYGSTSGLLANFASVPVCTLVACPSKIVMQTWLDEIHKFVKPGTFRIRFYCGEDNRRQRSNKIIAQVKNNEIDILLATYQVITAELKPEYNKRGTKRYESIHDVEFHRLIVDEAHHIKNPDTASFEGVVSIAGHSTHCLALTGTPFVNTATDIFSLFKILGFAPFDDRSVFDRLIGLPIQARNRSGLTRLRNALSHVFLRRTKAILPNLDIFNKTIMVHKVDFANDDHKKIYDTLYQVFRAIFDGFLNGGGEDEEMPAVAGAVRARFTMANRILQSCSHGALVPRQLFERAQQVLSKCQDNRGKMKELTAQEADDIFRHLQIGECVQDNPSNNEMGQPLHLPTCAKINHLLCVINSMASDEKGVIFSRWTSFLDKIQSALVAAGHSVVRLDGSVPNDERISAMRAFNDDSHQAISRFILCSLRLGEGINLTRGNVVFMMDPWWNEAQENQSIDRVHRIGQLRPVRVYHFVMKRSIEERMLHVQKAKAALGKGIITPLNRQEEKLAKTYGFLKDLYQLKSRDDSGKDQKWSA